jgi:DNA-binding beta-propeller fold protein YncE
MTRKNKEEEMKDKKAQASASRATNMNDDTPISASADEERQLIQEELQRKQLMALFAILAAMLLSVLGLFYRYVRQPAPLPQIVPLVNVNYPPHYLFSIYGVDQPVGVALSPDGERVYIAETGGERLIKVSDREGTPLFSFSPPQTTPAQRSPVYLAVDSSGNVFTTDRLQNAVFIYDQDGNYLDAMLAPNLTLNSYAASQVGGITGGTTFNYNVFTDSVHYQDSQKADKTLPAPEVPAWDPLGVRFDPSGNLWLTDVAGTNHLVREFPAADLVGWPKSSFQPAQTSFGKTGQNPGEFLYPNVAVVDSQNRIYVADGNNGRVSAWDAQGRYLFQFGRGSGDGELSLPRGMFIDGRDRLHVVDAVDQNVKVYDVSGQEPIFLYAFGDWGLEDGLFNYPNDIVLDGSGRLYIADRENNRVQVWSY